MLGAVSRAYLLAQAIPLTTESRFKSRGMDVWFLFGSEDEGVKILVTSQDQKPQPQRLGFIGCAASHMVPASFGKVLQSQGCC